MRWSSASVIAAWRNRFCTVPFFMTSTASTSSVDVRMKRSCLSTSVSARGATTTAAVPVSSERSLPVSRITFWPGSSDAKRSRIAASSSVRQLRAPASARR